MKKIFLIIILSLFYSIAFCGSVVKVQLDDSDIIINENGEVIIDGVKYSEDVIETAMENNGVIEVSNDSNNIYRSKNVDWYNKWYNKNVKKIEANRGKSKKKILYTIFGIIGSISSLFAGFLIVRSIIRSRKEKSVNRPKPNIKPSSTGLEVIGSAIKNDNKAISGSTGPINR